jgi:hypothetical protein
MTVEAYVLGTARRDDTVALLDAQGRVWLYNHDQTDRQIEYWLCCPSAYFG